MSVAAVGDDEHSEDPEGQDAADGGSVPPASASVPPPAEAGQSVPPPRGTRTTPEERERDRELVRRVQRGDEGAFRELFDRYHRRAFSVAFGVVRNQQDALDILQDAFVKVHKHIDNFQGTSSFYTWLYRIVMNLSIDHVRRQKKGRDVDYDDQVRRSDEEIGDGSILPSLLGQNPRRSILRRELAEAIDRALEELPDYHRAVLLLREVDGLSYEEMAKILEVPKGTIMSRLFHARRKMQEALAPYVQGELDILE
ncbi:MAG: sigma-70 family RNA polymerase sigma factor [Myxococcales bacterium]|nr:sigma-70 family RNA polymerase sigma factor [Myxococcales bacterium]